MSAAAADTPYERYIQSVIGDCLSSTALNDMCTAPGTWSECYEQFLLNAYCRLCDIDELVVLRNVCDIGLEPLVIYVQNEKRTVHVLYTNLLLRLFGLPHSTLEVTKQSRQDHMCLSVSVPKRLRMSSDNDDWACGDIYLPEYTPDYPAVGTVTATNDGCYSLSFNADERISVPPAVLGRLCTLIAVAEHACIHYMAHTGKSRSADYAHGDAYKRASTSVLKRTPSMPLACALLSSSGSRWSRNNIDHLVFGDNRHDEDDHVRVIRRRKVAQGDGDTRALALLSADHSSSSDAESID